VPQPSAPIDTGALPRTVERHLDEILGAVPQPDPIELAVLDAQGLLCAEEVVSAALFLASDEARYVTGVTLPIDGGSCLK